MLLARAVGAWPVPLLAVFAPDNDRALFFLFYRFWLGAVLLAGLVTLDRGYLLVVPIYLLLFLAVARDEARSLVGGVRGTVRGSGWILWGRVIRPAYNWTLYRLVPRIRDRWRASAARFRERRHVLAESIATAWRASGVAIGASISALVGGGRAARRSIGAGIGAAAGAIGRAATGTGQAIGGWVTRAWAEVRRFTWRAWRKCRRTVLGVVRSDR
jgi:hypothetical protein